MKILFIGLSTEWANRLRESLGHHPNAPLSKKEFTWEEKIFEGDEPVMAIVHVGDSPEEAFGFCRRLRDSRSPSLLQILACTTFSPDKESWTPFHQAGVDYILSKTLTDVELNHRLAMAECMLNSSFAKEGDVPSFQREMDLIVDTENVPCGIFYSTLDGKFLNVNDGMLQILGYSSREELMQVDIPRDIYLDSKDRARLIATTSPCNYSAEVVWKRRDGSLVTLQLSGNWIVDKQRHMVFGKNIVWDVSEQKRVQNILRIQRDLGIALARTSDLKETPMLLLDAAMRIEGVDCGGIYLAEPDTKTFQLAASRGISPSFIETASVFSTESPQKHLCLKGNPRYFVYKEFDDQVKDLYHCEGIKCVAVIPILFDDRVIAAMYLGSRSLDEFPATTRLVMETLALQIGGAIARIQAEEQLGENAKRYRLIAENVNDVVWSAKWRLPDFSLLSKDDPNLPNLIMESLDTWQFDFISPSIAWVLGYTAEECMADKPTSRMASDLFASKAGEMLQLLASHRSSEAFRRTYEIPMVAKDGTQLQCEITIAVLQVDPEKSAQIIGILRNVTAKFQAREALKKNEAHLRGLFENLPDIVTLLDQDAIIHFINHTKSNSLENLPIGKNYLDFVHESCRESCQDFFARTLAGQGTQCLEVIDIHENIWSCRIVPINGNPERVMVIGTDITEHKKAAEAIAQEQDLLRQLIDLQERDRKFLSYEIHDGFAQQLTGALFHLEAYKQLREVDRPNAEKNLDRAASMISRSIDETRRLISGLRPPILDESGILAAVEYLICENRERTGIDIMFTHDLQSLRLAPPLECAIFRIVQESMTNACRHSQSDFIRVELNQFENTIQIVVFDEGVGFHPDKVDISRFGLGSIRERARLLGGHADIISSPGEGCRVCVELPLIEAVNDPST